ncbi:tape measure protein [Rhodococcus phage ReqiDocB7]|uniref:tail length tape measure protein n=1 Tax=Rhodococcus phage ReqiDocB7 TaxID=691966 RepID=UPI0001CDD758|nr:tail length tape measure protein [Rhodococcus phage ReqiDocB7]ADD80808.1 tape measure protein [Rhodococcus phage ReqiDocB7]
MDTLGSEYNILIRVIAKQARAEVAALRAEIAALTKAGAGSNAAAAAGLGPAGTAAMKQSAAATTAATAGTLAYTNQVKAASAASGAWAVKVQAANSAVLRAHAALANATDALRVAELRRKAVLANPKASELQIAAAETSLATARRRVTVATDAVATAEGRRTAVLNASSAAAAKAAAAEAGLASTNTLNRMRALGAATTWSGKQISMFFTLPLAAAGAAAFKWQMDNEKAATHLAKVYDGLASDIDSNLDMDGVQFNGSSLDKFFTALSEKMGQAKSDVIEIGAIWAQVGVKGSQLAAATRLTTEAMVLGDMDATQATDALVAIQAQYRLAFGDFEKEAKAVQDAVANNMPIPEFQTLTSVLAQLNIIENQTGASMQDLVIAFSKTAANARQAGIDAKTLGAHIAALVPSMGSAANAGTALKSIYAHIFRAPEIEKSAAAMEYLATNAGLTADAFMSADFKGKGLGVGLEQMADAYAKLNGAQKLDFAQKVFGIHQYGRAMQLLDDISLRAGAPDGGLAGIVDRFNDLDEAGKRALIIEKFSDATVTARAGFDALSESEQRAAIQTGMTADEIADHMRKLEKATSEGAEGLSYYSKALEGATDQKKTYDTYFKELKTVLESNPQKFKQIGVILQNAMTEAIIPIIPALLWIAKSVAKVAVAFGNLSPEIQKIIMLFLLAIAAVGPLATVFGSFILMGSVLGRVFGSLSKMVKFLGFHFLGLGDGAKAGAEGVAKNTSFIKKLLRGLTFWRATDATKNQTIDAAAEASRTATAQSGASARVGIGQWEQAARAAAAGGGTAAEAVNQATQTQVQKAGITKRVKDSWGEMVKRAESTMAGASWRTRAEIAEQQRRAQVIATSPTVAAEATMQGKRTAIAKSYSDVMTKLETSRNARRAAATVASSTVVDAADVSVEAKRNVIAAKYAALSGKLEHARNARRAASAAASSVALDAADITTETRRAMIATRYATLMGKLEASRNARRAAAVAASSTVVDAADVTMETKRSVIASKYAAIMSRLEVRRNAMRAASTTASSAALNAADLGVETRRAMIATQYATTMGALEASRNARRAAAATASGAAITVADTTLEQRRAAIQARYATLSATLEAQRQSRRAATIAAGTPAALAAQKAQDAAIAGAAAGGAAKTKGKGGIFGSLATGAMAAFSLLKPSTLLKGARAIPSALGAILLKAGSAFKVLGKPINALSKLLGVSGPIGWAIMGAITLITAFPGRIMEALRGAGDKVVELWNNVFGGDSKVPLLARPFVFGLEVIKSALLALPRIVVGVFNMVVELIGKAAKKVYEFFSYINPFAHHSPSLVENVTEGMAIVTNEFGDASKSIQMSMRSAYGMIAKFGTATRGLRMQVAGREDAKKREDIRRAAPETEPAYNMMLATQARLEENLKAVNAQIKAQEKVLESAKGVVEAYDKQLDGMSKQLQVLEKAATAASNSLNAAQDRLDRYSNAQLKGMRAMEDQMFENEMAQKRLQLALMDMGADGVDDATEAFAKLQGQIETVSGIRNELRMAGAGSDITSVFTDQINDLMGQQQQTNMGPIEEMRKELERLEQQAKRMDLVSALQFDPLNRQIDQLKSNTEELSFEAITSGIRSGRAEVAGYTALLDQANAAVDNQRASIERVQEARDLASEAVDREQVKLDGIKETYDQVQQALADVGTALDQYNSDIANTIQYLDELARAAEEAKKKQEELADSLAALEGAEGMDVPGGTYNVDEDLPSIDDMTKELQDNLTNSFGGFSITEPLKNLGRSIGDFFRNLWNDYIWPGIQALPGALINFFMGLPGMLFSAMSYLGGWAAGALVRIIWEALKGLFNFSQWIVEMVDKAFGAVVEWVKSGGIGRMFSAVGNWWSGIDWGKTAGDLWDGLWGGITGVFKNIWGFIYDNIVRPFIDGIKDGFGIHSPSTVMAEIGGYIIEGLINGLEAIVGKAIDFFVSLPGRLLDAMGDIGSFLADKWNKAFEWLKERLPDQVSGVLTFFQELPGKVINALGDAGSWLLGVGENIIHGLINGAGNILSKLGDFFLDKVPGWIKEPFKKALGIHSPSRVFAEYGVNVGQGFVDGVASMSGAVSDATAAMADAAMLDTMPTVALGVDVESDTGAASVKAPTSTLAQQVEIDVTNAQVAWDAYVAYMMGSANTLAVFYSTTYSKIGADNASQMNLMVTTQLAALDTLNTKSTATLTAMSVAQLAIMTKLVQDILAQITLMRDTIDVLFKDTNTRVTNSFQNLATNLNDIFANQIKPMFDSFEPMLGTLEGWFENTVANIGTIWDGVKEPVAKPSRFIINDVYNGGVRVAWNNVSGWLGLDSLPEFVAPFQTGGLIARDSLVNPNSPVNIARGGNLTGPADGDRKLFAGQGGEYVFSRKMVAAAGGTRTLDAFRSAVMAGKNLEGGGSVLGFQTGGTIPGAALYAQEMARKTFTGQPYLYGGVGPDGWDCSGLVGTVWAWLTGQPNPYQRFFTTEADFSRFGFERGLNGYFTMGVHNGGGGMLSHTASTLLGTNIESGGAHNSSIYGGPAAGADHPQFENQYTLKEIGGVFQSGGMGGGSAASMLDRVTAEFKKVMDPIKGSVPQLEGSIAALAGTGYQKYYDDVSKFLYGKASEYDAAHPARGNMPYDGSGVEQWRGIVQKVLREKGLPLNLDEKVLYQMMTESGGNPNAINDWDINWQNGTPSKGLMQVIDPTFQSYKDAGYDNIWDPESNIRASINYALAQYGSLENAYRGVGYDRGGWLLPGENQKVFNATGKPEAVLTNEDWNAIYEAANNPVDADMITEGVVSATQQMFGFSALDNLAEAVSGANEKWTQNIYGATKDTSEAAQDVATNTGKTLAVLDDFTKIGGDIATGLTELGKIAFAIEAAYNSEDQNFQTWAPVVTMVGELLAKLPDAKADYVPWAGFDVEWTTGMRFQKFGNDVSNIGKGLYNVVKDVLPPLLKSTATIGSAIEKFAIEQGPVITAAIAMFPTNPVGAAIMAVPAILQAIFTILPMVISAIVEIVPTLIKSIMRFFSSFMPDSVFSYEDMAAAAEAVTKNEQAIKDGTYLASRGVNQPGYAIENPANQNVNINIYGDLVMPNVKNGDDADSFINNVTDLAGGGA